MPPPGIVDPFDDLDIPPVSQVSHEGLRALVVVFRQSRGILSGFSLALAIGVSLSTSGFLTKGLRTVTGAPSLPRTMSPLASTFGSPNSAANSPASSFNPANSRPNSRTIDGARRVSPNLSAMVVHPLTVEGKESPETSEDRPTPLPRQHPFG